MIGNCNNRWEPKLIPSIIGFNTTSNLWKLIFEIKLQVYINKFWRIANLFLLKAYHLIHVNITFNRGDKKSPVDLTGYHDYLQEINMVDKNIKDASTYFNISIIFKSLSDNLQNKNNKWDQKLQPVSWWVTTTT